MEIEIVGSFLPSERLTQAREEFSKGLMNATDYMAIEDESVSELVGRQIQLGLKRVTSGELRREYWNLDFWFGLDGIAKARFDSPRVYQNVDSYSDLIRIMGKIGYNSQHPFFKDMAFLKEMVGGKAVCMQTLPSPSDLFLELLLLSEGKPERIYPLSETLLKDIAVAYNMTILELYRLGCRGVQYDDTAFGRLCQDNFTKRLLQGGIDLITLQSTLITLINDSLKNLPKDMETSIFLSGGDMIVPEWEYIEYPDNVMPKVLREVNVDSFYLPIQLGNHYQLEGLCHVPKGKKVVLGLIDAHSPYPEDTELIRDAITKARKHITSADISISTRTGFKLTNHQGRGLTFEDQWNKLKFLKEIAEDLR